MKTPLKQESELSRTWQEAPDIIRRFIEVRPSYAQLCGEVEYILAKTLSAANVEYSTLAARAKSLESFAEKISRKAYADPLREITDLAGVRVVYLYKGDREKIERLVQSEFDVIERVDKDAEAGEDRFGYGALHYLVHLGATSSGARYDDLKHLVCEIQIRTVLQDAWALIAHHLTYKQETDVPKALRRRLNSLSGLFETADDQFENIRTERVKYVASVQQKQDSPRLFLQQDVNADTLTAYLQKVFGAATDVGYAGLVSRNVSSLIEFGYKTLNDVEGLLTRTKNARDAMRNDTACPYSVGEVAWALAFVEPKKREDWSSDRVALFKKHENLVDQCD